MTDEMSTYTSSAELYQKIVKLIQAKKAVVSQAVNTGMVFLYWEIGETICQDVLDNTKAEYGQRIVDEVSEKLTETYGKGFNRSAVFRMVKFYTKTSHL